MPTQHLWLCPDEHHIRWVFQELDKPRIHGTNSHSRFQMMHSHSATHSKDLWAQAAVSVSVSKCVCWETAQTGSNTAEIVRQYSVTIAGERMGWE